MSYTPRSWIIEHNDVGDYAGLCARRPFTRPNTGIIVRWHFTAGTSEIVEKLRYLASAIEEDSK